MGYAYHISFNTCNLNVYDCELRLETLKLFRVVEFHFSVISQKMCDD